jgi:hypothetical protein
MRRTLQRPADTSPPAWSLRADSPVITASRVGPIVGAESGTPGTDLTGILRRLDEMTPDELAALGLTKEDLGPADDGW